MFCNKCGSLIKENSKFCGNCGTAVPVQNNVQQNANVMPNTQIPNMQQNAQTYQNYDKIINPSMKKYAILSVVIPAISILIYWNIGLTIYIAIALAALGFDFAKKGRTHSKTLSTIGYVLSSILVLMAIIMCIFTILE